jgi:Na+/phosphate symporter
MEFVDLSKTKLMIKKIKQNGILFIGGGLGVLGLSDLIDFTEPTKNILSTVAFILMALPFPFYINDWIRILKRN